MHLLKVRLVFYIIIISLYCATILASGITYSSGPIFFEFTVELVYPVPEGVVGGFLTVVYNTTGMIFLFLFNIRQTEQLMRKNAPPSYQNAPLVIAVGC